MDIYTNPVGRTKEIYVIENKINEIYAGQSVDAEKRFKECRKNQFTYEEVTLIIEILRKTSRSFRDIARQFECQHSIISQINQGTAKKYRRKNLSYPIRQFG